MRRDGSTVTAFDTILRCYSEGCTDPQNPKKSVPKTENLTVCLGPGTFSTLGAYDYLIAIPHKNPAGFTIGKGWKIHGAGKDKTVVKLSDYLPITDPANLQHMPVNSGIGLVFGTNSDSASGIEISDLTIDGNYPELKSRARQKGVTALTLEAIHLRSDMGGHRIHDVNVVNAAAEIGAINPRWEAFPIWILSVDRSKPGQDRDNIIENVSVKQSVCLVCTFICVANATADVRNNVVEGVQIGYGGWDLAGGSFHDNTAINTDYGFNIDSLVNNGVTIERNKIVHPRRYGFVLGGAGTFANFKFLDNTVQIDRSGVIGFVFHGGVTGAVIVGNKVLGGHFFRGERHRIQKLPCKPANPGRITTTFTNPTRSLLECHWSSREHRKNRRTASSIIETNGAIRAKTCLIITVAHVSPIQGMRPHTKDKTRDFQEPHNLSTIEL